MKLKILELDEEAVKSIIKQHVEDNYGTVVDMFPEVGVYDYGDSAEFEGITVTWKEGTADA